MYKHEGLLGGCVRPSLSLPLLRLPHIIIAVLLDVLPSTYQYKRLCRVATNGFVGRLQKACSVATKGL